MKGLLDTSIFIGREHKRPMGRLPQESAISVVTLAELHLGVLMAGQPRVRAQRLRTLADVERTFTPLPVDDEVARRFAGIVTEARRKGRRPKIMDTFIAATAAANSLPVYTQDADFDQIPGVKVVRA